MSDQRRAGPVVFLGERAEQRAIADHVDHARDAAAQPVDLAQRRRREHFRRGAGHAHAVLHVARGLLGGERIEVVTARDALRQLAQVGLVEQRTQFRLADQDDLQQLGRGRLEVGEQPHLFERLGAQVLGLVHDQHHAAAARVRVEQLAPDQVHQRLGAAAPGLRHGDVQLLADRQQELRRRDPRVQDQRHVGVARQLLEQAADDGGLAGAHFARELDEAARLVDAVHQVRERLRVPLTEVQVAGVGRDRERLFLESEKARVHAGLGRLRQSRGGSPMMPALAGRG